MLTVLDRAEYIFVTSNRQYDSMPRIPTRFPLVIRYYDALFGGQLGFERVGDYTSYPSIFGIPLPDQGAEEAWTVYDHPRVQIFKKTAGYDSAQVAALLGAVDWDRIVIQTAKGATQAPNALLLTPEERRRRGRPAPGARSSIPAISPTGYRSSPGRCCSSLLGLVGLPFAWLAAAVAARSRLRPRPPARATARRLARLVAGERATAPVRPRRACAGAGARRSGRARRCWCRGGRRSSRGSAPTAASCWRRRRSSGADSSPWC